MNDMCEPPDSNHGSGPTKAAPSKPRYWGSAMLMAIYAFVAGIILSKCISGG